MFALCFVFRSGSEDLEREFNSLFCLLNIHLFTILLRWMTIHDIYFAVGLSKSLTPSPGNRLPTPFRRLLYCKLNSGFTTFLDSGSILLLVSRLCPYSTLKGTSSSVRLDTRTSSRGVSVSPSVPTTPRNSRPQSTPKNESQVPRSILIHHNGETTGNTTVSVE